MPDSSFYSSDQIARYIEASGESDNVDAKGPMSWDRAASSASLAKDVAAFANSRDGGVLVIGKTETDPGQFDSTGLTKNQASSFETTKVASWINSHFSPPVSLICHQPQIEKRTFVVITIAEFEDVPIFCTKSYHDPNDPKKLLIRERTIYVRNSNAESAPIGTVEELRTLIGLATKKRADQLLETFHAMLKGQPLVAGPSEEQKYDTELEEVLASLDADAKDWRTGTWQLVFHPSNFRPDRWPDDDLEALIHKHSVRVQREFPGCQSGIHRREWGISNDIYGDQWAFTRSGLFVYRIEFWENHQEYVCPWHQPDGKSEPGIQRGKWIEFKTGVFTMIQFFMFMTRMVEEYDTDESIKYALTASPIAGRALASLDPRIDIGLGEPQECRAQRFQRSKSFPVGEFRASWEDECARAMKQFFELFPGQHVPLGALGTWIEKYKHRKFL